MRLTIDPMRPIADIDRNLFGHFVEMMFDCVDPGMWAEHLVGRGFESSDANGDGVPDDWTPIGRHDSYAYAIENGDVLAPSAAQRITVYVHFDGYRGVRQAVCLNQGSTYTGYAWLKGDAGARVAVSVRDEDGRVLGMTEEVLDGGDWCKVQFTVDSDECMPHAFFDVRLMSAGTILIDQCSLRPDNAVCGLWREVMEHISALEPSVIRYPGGCFADCYHFQDGLGPIDRRPARGNAHWGGIELNHFGTDEFIAFCRHVGAEPLITINFAATAEEAAAWVEYVNGAPDTVYGRMRAENGHAEPYHVKYWDIGNETFGDWEIYHCTAQEYPARFRAFVEAMKAVDPSIVILACGGDGNYHDQTWNREALMQAGELIDILTLHMYAPLMKQEVMDNEAIHYALVGAPVKYQRILDETMAVLRETCGESSPVKLGITEWNANYFTETTREHSLEAGLFSAGLLNLMLRNAKDVVMANCSDLVNGWPGGIVRSERGKARGTATYHAIRLVAQARPVTLLASACESPRYDSAACGNIAAQRDIPLIDAACCRTADGRVAAFIVNRSLTEDMELTLDGMRASGIEHTEIWAEKTSDDQFDIRTTALTGNRVTLKRHSINRLIIADEEARA